MPITQKTTTPKRKITTEGSGDYHSKPSPPITGRKQQSGPNVGLIKESNVKELPMWLATSISSSLHIFLPIFIAGFLALVLLILSVFFNINWQDWFKFNAPKPDIEFVLVKDTDANRPETPLLKGEFNQEAGGETNPDQPIAPPDEPSAESTEASAATPSEQQTAQEPPKEETVDDILNQAMKEAIEAPIDPKPDETAESVIKTPNSSEKPEKTADAAMETPTNQQASPNSPSNTGSIASSHREAGNPQKGDASQPGVDVEADVNFGPYMSELKRRLTRNWHPPRGDRSKRVVLKFEIGRDGRLLSLEIDKSSNQPGSDEAALNAVRMSAPFRRLPVSFKGRSIPILFTFDYTVYGNSRRF